STSSFTRCWTLSEARNATTASGVEPAAIKSIISSDDLVAPIVCSAWIELLDFTPTLPSYRSTAIRRTFWRNRNANANSAHNLRALATTVVMIVSQPLLRLDSTDLGSRAHG